MLHKYSTWLILIGIAASTGAAVSYVPQTIWWQDRQQHTDRNGHDDHDGHDDHEGHEGHEGHDDHEGHDHAGHDDANSVELSDAARRGIKLQRVGLGMFDRTMTVPAVVVERAGWSQVHVNAPLSGIVTRIYPVEGVSVKPGQPLFDIRLTHEELVKSQRDFLQSAEELDVVRREIKRLKSVGEGVIAGKRILEREYEQQILEAALHAQRQALLLHGLSKEQIDTILETRNLLQGLTIVTPPFAEDDDDHSDFEHLFHVQSLRVNRGQHVEAGQDLCVLADHCALYIEGQAFEEDAERLEKAATEQWKLTAVVNAADGKQVEKKGLRILRVADRVDPESRALRFYVSLPNELLPSAPNADRKFLSWRYRPGQRVDVLIPIERWDEVYVLPVDAVVDDGVESYIFKLAGDHFDRIPVEVKYRGPRKVVLAGDGGVLAPGDEVAVSSVYQMQVQLKNKAGGAVDPHAGHNH